MVKAAVMEDNHKITTPLGEIRFTDEDIILFPDGLIGFEDKLKYIIVTKKEFEPFQWLVCIDDPSLQLPIIDPIQINQDYNITNSNGELATIGLDSQKNREIYTIVTVGKDIQHVSANFRGPIIINTTRKLGKQIILSESNYSLKQPILAGSQN